MANTVYENFVLESKATDLLSTKVNARSLMTVDTSLTESAGMKKTINVYTYTGEAEALGIGEGNEKCGSIAYVPADHTVQMLQQKFAYFDEDQMKDPAIVEMMMTGAAQVMANKLTDDYYAAIDGATAASVSALSYDDIVDVIAELKVEDESELFLLVNPDGKAALRKDSDYKAARMGEIIYNGQVGTISGIPVIVSKAVPADTAFIATTEAVTCFMKKDVEVEQERDADTRDNKVWLRTAYVVALTDKTKCRKIEY